MIINAIQCPNCKDIIFSRTGRDCRHCTCTDTYIDGGFDSKYGRIGAIQHDKVRSVRIEVDATKQELYDDWNRKTNKHGLYKHNEAPDTVRIIDAC